MDVLNVDIESDPERKVFVLGLGFQECVALHILAGFAVGHAGFPHGNRELTEQPLPKDCQLVSCPIFCLYHPRKSPLSLHSSA